jgi:hypothetical protein
MKEWFDLRLDLHFVSTYETNLSNGASGCGVYVIHTMGIPHHFLSIEVKMAKLGAQMS